MEVFLSVLPPKSGDEPRSEYMPLPWAMLRRAADFAGSVRDAREMRTRAPVLMAAVNSQRFEKHARSGRESFRVGVIEEASCTMMTLRYQKGEAQFVWLADATDPDFWKAVDNMTRSRQLAFALSDQDDLWFLKWNAPSSLGPIEVYRREIGRNNANFLATAGSAIADGSLAKHFSSVFPDVEVKYRCLNILMTPHLKRVLDSIPNTTTVSPDSAAAGGFASIAPAPDAVQ